MDSEQCLRLAKELVDATYVEQGAQELRSRERAIRSLLAQRSLQQVGWDEDTLDLFLRQLSLMDSNNFGGSVGAGEREARIWAPAVRRRHYGLGHGVGRSGDVAAVQPKAAGSSLIYKLTNRLALAAIQLCGVTRAASAIVLPAATGLSLALVLLALRGEAEATRRRWASAWVGGSGGERRCTGCSGSSSDGSRARCCPCPSEVAEASAALAAAAGSAGLPSLPPPLPLPAPRYVIWSRIDQKSCFKAISTAGLIPIVVDVVRVPGGDELVTDLPGIAAALAQLGGPLNVLAVVTTTSCFAPRAPDDVVGVAKLCAAWGVPHVINNAYGLQAGAITHVVNEAARYRVDAIVQSTDKNFLVPVGGAIVAAPKLPRAEGACGAAPCSGGGAGTPPPPPTGHPSLASQHRSGGSSSTGGSSAGGSTDGAPAGSRRSGGRPKSDSSSAAAAAAAAVAEAALPGLPPGASPCPCLAALVSACAVPAATVTDAVSRVYPGRASIAPILDLFVSLLSMGEGGLKALLATRKAVAAKLRAGLTALAARHGERLLASPHNPISYAMTLGAGGISASSGKSASATLSYVGALLFARGVSGTRVVPPGEKKTIDGVTFHGYGASVNDYGVAYLTAAAAIGMSEADVDVYLTRLDKALVEWRKQTGAPPLTRAPLLPSPPADTAFGGGVSPPVAGAAPEAAPARAE